MTEQPRIAGVILSGGLGRRFGGVNKGLIELGGVPLAKRAALRLAPQVTALGINANRDVVEISAWGWPVVADGIGGAAGPLDGILGALAFARAQCCAGVVCVPADTPFFPCDLVERLCAGGLDAPALAHDGARLHPALSWWPAAVEAKLAAWLRDAGSLKLMDFAASAQVRTVPFAPDAASFFNINTPDDLAAAERMLRDGRTGASSE